MSKRLTDQISSEWVSAANSLRGKTARRRIVAYVESYDDILFWRMALSRFENDKRYFEVMLPSRTSLSKGKKQALMQLMQQGGGEDLIACVDADYDYLLQGKTYQSDFMLSNPYVAHTYVYAIENYQCYAPSLHNVCVMATLNDHYVFDFQQFLSAYSRAVFPLFVWSIMLYGRLQYSKFCISDFNKVVTIRQSRLENMMENVERVRRKCFQKVKDLQRQCPGMKEEYLKTKNRLLGLGVTPDTTYLYIQGHHLFDSVVTPVVQTACDVLRREREHDIRQKALHAVQMNNELSAYTNSQSDVPSMMKKNMGYMESPQYQRLLQDLERIVNNQNIAKKDNAGTVNDAGHDD